jgi:hypothetical protein
VVDELLLDYNKYTSRMQSILFPRAWSWIGVDAQRRNDIT